MLCRIGEVEVWRILEMNGPFLPPEDLFPDAGDDVGEVIRRHASRQICGATGRMILPVQGFLLRTPDHLILVDACVGNHKESPGFPDWRMKTDNRFMSSLESAGAAPEDVGYVLCTHLHTDHVGWNTRLEDGRWAPTFPNARYLMPRADEGPLRESGSALYGESVSPVIEAGQAELVEADHQLGDYVSLIPTPGHTPGHVSVRIRSGAAEAVITGDALHSTAQCWRPDWAFKYDADADLAKTSRRRLLETVAEGGQRVIGSHFTLPSIGRVQAEGDAFRWDEDD